MYCLAANHVSAQKTLFPNILTQAATWLATAKKLYDISYVLPPPHTPLGSAPLLVHDVVLLHHLRQVGGGGEGTEGERLELAIVAPVGRGGMIIIIVISLKQSLPNANAW